MRKAILNAGRSHAENVTVLRPDKHWAGWFIVRFADGHKLCVHQSALTF